MDELCPDRFTDPTGDMQHELTANCSCRYCGQFFHHYDGCTCRVCGHTRHLFLPYYLCPVCGKRVDKYHPVCHFLASPAPQKIDCQCSLCSQTFHDFQNRRCTRCSAWEDHQHVHNPRGVWDRLQLKDNRLYCSFNCQFCGQPCLQEYQLHFLSGSDWKHQPFVFRGGAKAYIARDLVGLSYLYPDDGCYHLLAGHFEPWLEYIGDRTFAAVCRNIRAHPGGLSPHQKLDRLIAEFCIEDNRVIDSDGQNWVAGWD